MIICKKSTFLCLFRLYYRVILFPSSGEWMFIPFLFSFLVCNQIQPFLEPHSLPVTVQCSILKEIRHCFLSVYFSQVVFLLFTLLFLSFLIINLLTHKIQELIDRCLKIPPNALDRALKWFAVLVRWYVHIHVLKQTKLSIFSGWELLERLFHLLPQRCFLFPCFLVSYKTSQAIVSVIETGLHI